MAVPKDPRQLETAEPFVSLFPIDPATRGVVTRSMRQRGYVADKPILVWRDAFGEKGRLVVVDGHTRRNVALELGLEVRATLRRFDSVEDALLTAIDEQSWRRSLNRSQQTVYVLAALSTLDNGTRGQGSRNDLVGRSARQLAEMLGVGTATIERARALVDFGDDALLERVKSGEIGLKQAIEVGRRADRVMSKAPAPEPEPEPTARTVDTPGGRTVVASSGFSVHIPDHPDEAPEPKPEPELKFSVVLALEQALDELRDMTKLDSDQHWETLHLLDAIRAEANAKHAGA